MKEKKQWASFIWIFQSKLSSVSNSSRTHNYPKNKNRNKTILLKNAFFRFLSWSWFPAVSLNLSQMTGQQSTQLQIVCSIINIRMCRMMLSTVSQRGVPQLNKWTDYKNKSKNIVNIIIIIINIPALVK